MELYTIGFTRKSLREFIELLRGARVDGVVDIRLNNTSQLAGYAKRDDLAFVLELVGIGYAEDKRLAPEESILDQYHADHDWQAYEKRFDALLAKQPLRQIFDEIFVRYQRPCLLCAEPEPSKCHRRLVAEAFVHIEPQLRVTHLVTAEYATTSATKVRKTSASNGTGKGRRKHGSHSEGGA